MDVISQAAAWTTMKEIWAEAESVNGPGSTLELTQQLRENLPVIIQDLKISTMLDMPCGDWNWMQRVDLNSLDSYIGWDVEPELIQSNVARFSKLGNVRFEQRNALTVDYPKVDLILCKDFLFHLDNEAVEAVLRKFRESGSKYLLVSHMPGASNVREYTGSQDGVTGYFACSLDVSAPPFNMGRPILSIREQDSIQPGYDMANNLQGHAVSLFRL